MVAGVVVAVTLVACSKASPSTIATTTLPASPSITTPAPTSPSPSPSPSFSPTLPDGRSFGYIKDMRTIDGGVSTSAYALTFDLAYFLTGEAANQACMRDHRSECPPPDDAYIVNNNPLLRTLPVSESATVELIDWANCCDTTDGAIADFVGAMHAHDTEGLYHSTSPYWITVQDGVVVKFEEQYLP